jgi:hypothetical protein
MSGEDEHLLKDVKGMQKKKNAKYLSLAHDHESVIGSIQAGTIHRQGKLPGTVPVPPR